LTTDDGDCTDTTKYEAYWAFRNHWLITNIARDMARCAHESTYDTCGWSRCLSCTYVVSSEQADLENREHYLEHLIATGRIQVD